MAGRKSKVKKAAVRKPAPRKHVKSRKVYRPAAPAHVAPAQEAAPQSKTPPEYPWNVVVTKGADKLPVTVTDAAHYERLVNEFGAGAVEVTP